MKPKSLSSKFASPCVKCHGWMPAGSHVMWEKGVGAWHAAACPAIPAAPPVIIMVPVGAEVAKLEVAIGAASEALKVAWAEQRAANEKYVEAVKVLGGCFACNGQGWVWHWDCEYPCSHEGLPEALYGRSPAAIIEAVPAVKALWEAERAAERKARVAEAEKVKLEGKLEALLEPKKGAVVEVVKGRKVKKGVRGKVAVVWQGPYGWSVKLEPEGAEPVWVAKGNVVVVENPVEVAAEMAAAA